MASPNMIFFSMYLSSRKVNNVRPTIMATMA
jgi:hypothetical protein